MVHLKNLYRHRIIKKIKTIAIAGEAITRAKGIVGAQLLFYIAPFPHTVIALQTIATAIDFALKGDSKT